VYLDGGPCAADVPSTIIDLTGSVPRLLRRGVIPVERLREVIPLALEEEEAPGDEAPADEAPADEVAQGEAVQDEVLQGEAVQDAEEAAPQGPAGPVHEDTGRPREVFHGPEEAAEQGNHAHRDAAG
jgi:hypothetical protein